MFFTARDPVCRVRVRKGTPHRSSFDGKIFYFDSKACRATFESDPKRFLGKGKSRKGLVEKLAEVSDGRPKSCH